MIEIKLFILPEFLKQTTALHENVDDKLLVSEIETAQDLFILPLLGTKLHYKILEDVSNNNLNGEYKFILENFIAKSLSNYVLSQLPEALNFQFWNKGVAIKTTDQSSTPDTGDLYKIVNRYKKRAEHYANECRKYILSKQSDFPEFFERTGIYDTAPGRKTYTTPIYLDERGDWKESDKPNNAFNEPWTPFN